MIRGHQRTIYILKNTVHDPFNGEKLNCNVEYLADECLYSSCLEAHLLKPQTFYTLNNSHIFLCIFNVFELIYISV